jgi:hypothetical protein
MNRISGSPSEHPFALIKNIRPAQWGLTIVDRFGVSGSWSNISIPNGIYIYNSDFILFPLTGSVPADSILFDMWTRHAGTSSFNQYALNSQANEVTTNQSFIVNVKGNTNY